MESVHHVRDAMATRFEAWLIGDDREHLDAVAIAALDEVSRIEHLLSRFDPRSEISRINRDAHCEPVLIDFEVLGILKTCLDWSAATGGHFDIAAQSGIPTSIDDVALDLANRTIRLLRPETRLDLGAFGKGYALDRAAEVLRENHVTRALLHGGTSSVLVLGTDAENNPWTVGLRGLASGGAGDIELDKVPLCDATLSTSIALGAGARASDIVNPQSGQPLTEQASCTVICPSAADAEVLSTALLSMGRECAATYTQMLELAGTSVAWIDLEGDRSRLTWLRR